MLFPLKDEGGGGGDYVTKALIAINVAIFLYSLLNFDYIIENYGVIPAVVTQGAALYTLFTSIFLHGGFIHLIGNMWYLWVFGDNVERSFGHAKYVLFYLATGLAGSLVHIVSDPSSLIPTIGASGAISGILGAYIVLHPKNRVDAVWTVGIIQHVNVSAKTMVGLWFLLQLINSGFSLLGAESGVAYLAHVGGFVAGAVLAYALKILHKL